jgi:hypothetical protein
VTDRGALRQRARGRRDRGDRGRERGQDDLVFGEAGCRFDVAQLAAELRADLKVAGVKRETLLERSDV